VTAPDERARDLQRLAFVLQSTLPGAPMIYYGDEAGMWGGDDPDDRKPMVWADHVYDAEVQDPRGLPRRPDPVAFDGRLFAFYRDVIALRSRLPALRTGEMRVIAANDAARAFAFSRSAGDEMIVVLVNAGESETSFDLSGPDGIVPLVPVLASRGALADIPSLVATFHDDGSTTYRNPVPARTAVVFRRVRGEDVRPGGLQE
jgi:glycosidase